MAEQVSGTDVIVVGAGIVGVTTAYELASAGHSVRLIDKGRVAGLQSSRNWGFVRRQGCDPVEAELVQHASLTWDRLGEEIGPALTLVKKGLINLTPDEAGLSKYRDWLRASGGDTLFGSRMVGPDEVRDLLPHVTGEWAGGLLTPADGHADPTAAGPAIAAAARARGVVIEEDVTALEITTSGGRVTGLRTSAGRRAAGRVVVTAGAWSGKLLAPLGLKVPVRWIRATAARTTPAAQLTELAVHVPAVGFSQLADGSVIFGSAAWSDYDIGIDTLGNLRLFLPNFARNRKMIRLHLNEVAVQDVLRRLPRRDRDAIRFDWPRMDEPPPNRKKIERAHRSLTALVPRWESSRIARAWAGTVDVTPDALPVVAAPPQYAGLVVATGMSSHGFGIGPGVAVVAAELVQGKQPSVDLEPFRIERFAEGPVRAHHHL